jgi:hypothetical protein
MTSEEADESPGNRARRDLTIRQCTVRVLPLGFVRAAYPVLVVAMEPIRPSTATSYNLAE